MARYKVDIAAIGKARTSEEGHLKEVSADCIFFWGSRSKAERRDMDVAFAIQNDNVRRLPCLLQDINDCLMSLRLPLRRPNLATTINDSAPAITGSD
nr:unnamed protein product [Spirometra erinaceieuropaei]